MTGRDLVVYILTNKLEDEPIFKDGTFVGFMTVDEAAVKMDVGIATVFAWMFQGRLEYVKIGETYLVPANCKLVINIDNV